MSEAPEVSRPLDEPPLLDAAPRASRGHHAPTSAEAPWRAMCSTPASCGAWTGDVFGLTVRIRETARAVGFISIERFRFTSKRHPTARKQPLQFGMVEIVQIMIGRLVVTSL